MITSHDWMWEFPDAVLQRRSAGNAPLLHWVVRWNAAGVEDPPKERVALVTRRWNSHTEITWTSLAADDEKHGLGPFSNGLSFAQLTEITDTTLTGLLDTIMSTDGMEPFYPPGQSTPDALPRELRPSWITRIAEVLGAPPGLTFSEFERVFGSAMDGAWKQYKEMRKR